MGTLYPGRTKALQGVPGILGLTEALCRGSIPGIILKPQVRGPGSPDALAREGRWPDPWTHRSPEGVCMQMIVGPHKALSKTSQGWPRVTRWPAGALAWPGSPGLPGDLGGAAARNTAFAWPQTQLDLRAGVRLLT